MLTPFVQYSQLLRTKAHYFHGELPPIIRGVTKEFQYFVSCAWPLSTKNGLYSQVFVPCKISGEF